MILMKFSFVPQTSLRFFLQNQDFIMKSINKSYTVTSPCTLQTRIGTARSVSLSRQGLAALYCRDGDLAFYTSKMEVFFTCW